MISYLTANVPDGEAESEEQNQLTAAATSALFSLKADRASLEARCKIFLFNTGKIDARKFDTFNCIVLTVCLIKTKNVTHKWWDFPD